MIRSLYYHNPSSEGFEKMIRFFKKWNYYFLSLDELYLYLNGKMVRSNQHKFIFISLDDGWRRNLDLLPVIEKYNVPITIFVSTEPIKSGNFWWEYVAKKYGYKEMLKFKELPYHKFYEELNNIKAEVGDLERSSLFENEVKSLARHPLVSIQSHTVNHPILTSIPENELELELKDSQDILQCLTGKKVYAFSYPNGSLSSREVNAVKKYYKLAFTTEQKNIYQSSDKFLLPRYALTGDFFRDLLKMYGIWKWIKKLCFFYK